MTRLAALVRRMDAAVDRALLGDVDYRRRLTGAHPTAELHRRLDASRWSGLPPAARPAGTSHSP